MTIGYGGKPVSNDNQPRRRRRKEARPAEIVEAARKCFVLNGFAATRIEDVARKAGVSKGTVYLYFDTKEALFDAVMRANVLPVIDSLIAAIRADETTPAPRQLEFIARTMYREIVGTDRRLLLHLVIAEGPRFPWLTDFYCREILSKGREVIRAVIERGEARGELSGNGLDRHPEMLMAPTIVAALFSLLFARLAPVDLDDYIETHLAMGLRALEAAPGPELPSGP
jgi:AcrR family transcriptional regulator